MKTKEELQLEAVRSILNGDLLLEEAMAKYAVKDRRTIAGWVRKLAPLLQSSTDISAAPKTDSNKKKATSITQITAPQQNLPEQLRNLEVRLQQLEELNSLLMRHMNLLAEQLHQLSPKPNGAKSARKRFPEELFQ